MDHQMFFKLKVKRNFVERLSIELDSLHRFRDNSL